MNEPVDHYDLLGVLPSASPDLIRSAYRVASKRTHPDLNHGSANSTELAAAVNAARDVLLDEATRTAYDRSLAVGSAASPRTMTDARRLIAAAVTQAQASQAVAAGMSGGVTASAATIHAQARAIRQLEEDRDRAWTTAQQLRDAWPVRPERPATRRALLLVWLAGALVAFGWFAFSTIGVAGAARDFATSAGTWPAWLREPTTALLVPVLVAVALILLAGVGIRPESWWLLVGPWLAASAWLAVQGGVATPHLWAGGDEQVGRWLLGYLALTLSLWTARAMARS